jgi:hypothetical protein
MRSLCAPRRHTAEKRLSRCGADALRIRVIFATTSLNAIANPKIVNWNFADFSFGTRLTLRDVGLQYIFSIPKWNSAKARFLMPGLKSLSCYNAISEQSQASPLREDNRDALYLHGYGVGAVKSNMSNMSPD